jgi:hypothetical protein
MKRLMMLALLSSTVNAAQLTEPAPVAGENGKASAKIENCAALRLRATTVNKQNQDAVQSGSCVAIDCNEFGLKGARYLITAAHVVSASGAKISIELTNGRWVACELVSADRNSDVALLKAAEDMAFPLKLAPDQCLWVSGCPESKPSTIAYGAMTKIDIEVPMAHGMSGGAVFNWSREIAGIIVSGPGDEQGNMRGDVGTFVTASVVRRFLKTLAK